MTVGGLVAGELLAGGYGEAQAHAAQELVPAAGVCELVADAGEHPRTGVSRALELGGDRAVVHVSHPAAHASLPGEGLHGPAKAHALHRAEEGEGEAYLAVHAPALDDLVDVCGRGHGYSALS